MRRVLVSLLLVAGCVPADETVDGVPPRLEERGPDSCGLAENEALVGEPVSAFDEAAWDKPVRIIPPGGIVTMEYNPQRLNIDLDERGRIVRFWCG
jgi:hypothetical protein